MPYTIQEYLQDSTPTVRAADTYVHARGREGMPIRAHRNEFLSDTLPRE